MERRVLVVDDDANILKLFSRILSKAGYTVRAVASSGETVRILEKDGPFDLLVLDLCMPKPDGLEILSQIHSQYPGQRILVVSGYLEGALLPASEFLGATATLVKSDAAECLLPTVRNLLR